MKTLALVFAIATLAACSEHPSAADAPARAPDTDPVRSGNAAQASPAVADAPDASAAPVDGASTEADYLGRWTGVEGMYLVVAAKPGGGVALDMQWDLDHKGSFDGSVTAEGLRFMRNGVAESAVHSNGDATGLKHLAGKQDCLTVKPGEGYCRD